MCMRKNITLYEFTIILFIFMYFVIICDILNKREVKVMKNIRGILCRISPWIVSCFALVLTLNANSANCFVMHQPKTPAKLNAFKKIK